MAAVTEVLICNIALSKIRAERINSFADESEEAIACNLYYEPVRDEVLRSHPWPCAKDQRTLAPLSSEPEDPSFRYQYQLPTNPYCLRVLSMLSAPTAKYKIIGRKLLTSESVVTIEYIKRVINPADFDALLVKAIAYRLAADLAIDITNSKDMEILMLRLYESQLRRASGIASLEGEPIEPEDTSWVDSAGGH